jgi:RHS repeat-associated protein
MTTAAIFATREVSWRPSFYRGEQYDSDLGLYYLRARYYNPQTGRFLSRDPEDGNRGEPKTLHKYLYAGGDPVNAIDPRGREVTIEYALVMGVVGFNTAAPRILGWKVAKSFYCIELAILAAMELPGKVGIAGGSFAGWLCSQLIP